ncbi:MAG: response regulator [Candidatus Omnitrophota bacterium]
MPKKILVVDDTPIILEMVKDILVNAGYNVITAGDGVEALDKTKTEKPDLVLLDIMMPKMSGHEMLKKLRQDKDTKSIPVVMFSSQSDGGNILKSQIDGGAVDYITKPYNPKVILDKVTELLPK